MKLTMQRLTDTGDETLGKLFLDEKFLCYVLEDTYRDRKVKHETRIPAGVYELNLRAYGGHYNRYIKRFKDFEHKGMIELMNVAGFTHILIHIGNSKKDTSGCLLVGDGFKVSGSTISLMDSTKAYRKVYPIIQKMIGHSGATLEILDEQQISDDEIDGLIKGTEQV